MPRRFLDSSLVLAADIGGTKTRLGLFRGENTVPFLSATVPTGAFETASDLVGSFLAPLGSRPRRACFGVAGVVLGRRVERTILPWDLDAGELERSLGIERLVFVNDVQATAQSVGALAPADLAMLRRGARGAAGTRAVLSSGTGLGEAALWWDGATHRAAPSEGGSASFAPRTEREIELLRFLAAEQGRVSVGHVCSGPGLQRIYRFVAGTAEAPAPQAITAEAAADRASAASEAVDIYVSILGARAGDVALGYGATGGVYLGGGIAPAIVDRLREGGFARAFLAKGGLRPMVRRIPVHVIASPDAAIVGASLVARQAGERRLRLAA